MNKNIVTVLKTISWILTGIIVVLAFLLIGVRLFGLQVYTVLSGSMEPEYPIGSLIYVKEVEPSSLEPGDVITYNLVAQTVATHRIVDVVSSSDVGSDELCFITKGDANDNVDNLPVAENRIIGKVVSKIPRLGYVAGFIQTPRGTTVSIIFGVAIFLFMWLSDYIEKELCGSDQKGHKPSRKNWFK